MVRRWMVIMVLTAWTVGCSTPARVPVDPKAVPQSISARPHDPPVGTEDQEAGPPLVGARWRTPMPVTGPAVAVAGTAVVYTADSGALALVGVDPATGDVRWEQPASPAYVLTGIPLEPTRVVSADGRELVAYFRPGSGTSLTTSLEVADPATGETVYSAGSGAYSQPLETCSDGVDVCYVRTSAGDEVRRRLDLTDGRLYDAPRPALRSIGPAGLSDVRTDREYLARMVGDRELWRVPVAEAFGPGFSTDGGWSWEEYGVGSLLVGWVGRAVDEPLDTPVRFDLAQVVTVGLDRATGQVRWRDVGSWPRCGDTVALPPPGTDGDPWPVRCRYRGAMTLQVAPERVGFEGLQVTVEGFDPGTGRTTWSVPLGPVGGLAHGGGAGGVLSPTEIVLPAPAGPVVVDLVTGARRRLGPAETAACAGPRVPVVYDEPLVVRGVALAERRGGVLFGPCPPGQGELSPSAVQATATVVGDWYVAAGPDGLTGYAGSPG